MTKTQASKMKAPKEKRFNSKDYYKRNKKRFQIRGKAYYQLHKAEKRIYWLNRYKLGYTLVAQYKKQPCMDCNRHYPSYVMHLDHRIPATKCFELSGCSLHKSANLLMAEIEKCDVVCANCHAERTFGKKTIL